VGAQAEAYATQRRKFKKSRPREHHRDADSAQDAGATREKGYGEQRGRLVSLRWSVGCGFFFALFVYFVEEVFEFYFLLGGH